MNYKYTIPAALIGVSIALVQTQVARAICSNSQVDTIAEKITVLIDSPEPGSGVIIKKEGNTYTVLTANHVVKNRNFKYTIVTPDKQRYSLNYQTVKQLSNKIDLAVLQFTSSKSYEVAKLGNSDILERSTNVYVAGFPKATAGVKLSVYDCRGGQVIANASQVTVDNGYNLIYDNPTLSGMSGGAVLNDQGELIAIHGQGEGSIDIDFDKINTSSATVKSGRNSGIPIKIFMELSAGLSKPPKTAKLKADDFSVQAGDKYRNGDYRGAILAYNEVIRLTPNDTEALIFRGNAYNKSGDKQAAIQDYNQAIKINPNYALAYNNRGKTRLDLGDKQGAIDDHNQALKINPNYADAYASRGYARRQLGDNQSAITDYNQALKINPNYGDVYRMRGNIRFDWSDYRAALEDYNQAIKINPNNTDAYSSWGLVRDKLGDKQGAINDYQQVLKINSNNYSARGIARDKLGDKQGAITDYTQAIKINPNNAYTYINRGKVRSDLGDKQGAIQDYNQAIKINPNIALAYFNRGINRSDLGDKQAAIQDYTQALKINPNDADFYYNRGNIYRELGDNQAAIQDYTQAIKIDPNYADAYYSRGNAYYLLENNQAAILDYQQAVKLYQQQGGNEELLRKAQDRIRELQR
ncbi:tetratricopeptide repeat protein [Dolichospermum circinale CS-534/05]|uniref:tetratricopeptide repeat-containing S1 family peptidase n=1 Tax=Dolichospermum circinale TaxID=109265 RepID=UPI00232FBFE8|nr:serine protease [Dolichospermum circinale]MDB9455908.1 tetratricopeptide repeat protein [Dolichospermum circinale CS-541/06]MDB9462569.1 tetratricopeptide repeat protein [Dolichospermum circinale CS-541/04]MDB9492299.1 tetratricopeptide repeat protein [Dolichospermum circinale CS-534/05]MDB9546380.1 tetratricopeptide repeat protein [Dolichospermum circinale CS-1031]